MSDRRWVPLLGFDGLYEISDDGLVKTLTYRGYKRRTPRLLTQHSIYGYRYVTLTKDRRTYSVRVHRAVLGSFSGHYPPGMDCAHQNGVWDDNRLENLAWMTPKANTQQKWQHGTMLAGERQSMAKLKDSDIPPIITRIKNGEDLRSIARSYGVSYTVIWYISAGKTWRGITGGEKLDIYPRGERASHAKLSEKDVIEIRNVYGKNGNTLRSLASDYGVSYSTIREIVKRLIWTHV